MANWPVQDWLLFLTALCTLVSAVGAAAVLVIKEWRTGVKIDAAAVKVDNVQADLKTNTAMTKAAAVATVKAAGAAAEAKDTAAIAATDTREAVDKIAQSLNGALTEKISVVVKEHIGPLATAFQAHIEQDDKNMVAIRESLKEFTEYVHLRNHDILDKMSAQSNKTEVLLRKMEASEADKSLAAAVAEIKQDNRAAVAAAVSGAQPIPPV